METPGKTWLEVSLTRPWSRDRQPAIPISVKRYRSKAHRLRAFARGHPEGRSQPLCGDHRRHQREGRRRRVSHDSVRQHRGRFAPQMMTVQQRFAHTKTPAKRGLLEWAAVGSPH